MADRFVRNNADFLFYIIWGVTLIISFRSGHQSQGNFSWFNFQKF